MKVLSKSLLFVLFFFFLLFYSSATTNEKEGKIYQQVLQFSFQDTTIEEEQIDDEDEYTPNVEDLFELYWELKKEEESSDRDTLYYEIIKAFDIFGAAFRELLSNYVIELSPLELIKFALNGITSNLDPYTNYFQDEAELSEVVSNREYVGLGIVVSVVDSSLFVVDFIDSLAKEISGLKLGDKIIYVDNVKLQPNYDTLRKYTSGIENTKITLKIEREGIDTLIKVETFRRQVEVPDVLLSKVFDLDNGKVFYVSIGQFSPEMPQRIKELVQNFCKLEKDKRKGIIIDLRDNPGGVLESAIELCELFLPPGSEIVSTRGRAGDEIKKYMATLNPIDTTTPLILIVNRGSASASEVVAGAIQDNDRGVIVGEQTFGKGIIQSVSLLPYDSYLKITTAKYFTPSGRSIHRNRFISNASRKIGKLYTMDTVFYTRSGRIMKESKGIQPDVEVKTTEDSPFFDYLSSKLLFMLFVSYLENTGSLDNSLINDPQKLLSSFLNYLKMKKINYSSDVETALDTLIEKIEKGKYDKETIKKLKEAKKLIQKPIEYWVQENKKRILDALKNEIQRRKVSFDEYKIMLLKDDIFFKESLNILKDKTKYNKILRING